MRFIWCSWVFWSLVGVRVGCGEKNMIFEAGMKLWMLQKRVNDGGERNRIDNIGLTWKRHKSFCTKQVCPVLVSVRCCDVLKGTINILFKLNLEGTNFPRKSLRRVILSILIVYTGNNVPSAHIYNRIHLIMNVRVRVWKIVLISLIFIIRFIPS